MVDNFWKNKTMKCTQRTTVIKNTLTAIKKHNPTVNAVVSINPDLNVYAEETKTQETKTPTKISGNFSISFWGVCANNNVPTPRRIFDFVSIVFVQKPKGVVVLHVTRVRRLCLLQETTKTSQSLAYLFLSWVRFLETSARSATNKLSTPRRSDAFAPGSGQRRGLTVLLPFWFAFCDAVSGLLCVYTPKARDMRLRSLLVDWIAKNNRQAFGLFGVLRFEKKETSTASERSSWMPPSFNLSKDESPQLI